LNNISVDVLEYRIKAWFIFRHTGPVHDVTFKLAWYLLNGWTREIVKCICFELQASGRGN